MSLKKVEVEGEISAVRPGSLLVVASPLSASVVTVQLKHFTSKNILNFVKIVKKKL